MDKTNIVPELSQNLRQPVSTQGEDALSTTGEIVIYNTEDDSVTLDVRLGYETVWLNRAQLAILFDRDIKTIGKHVSNALREEMNQEPVVAKFATTAADGKVYLVEHYNLDMILSVGYRVKSSRGIAFRRWANKVLKEYLLRGYAINPRLEQLERRVAKTEEKIDFFVKTSLPPVEGIFFDNQIFEAYEFVSKLIKGARKEIILIDNYIDETVLTLLDKRMAGVSATIYTKKISPQLQLDIRKHNSEYDPIEVFPFNKAHDRFLLIDDTVYHVGASIKDLGKSWFAFSVLTDITPREILAKLK